LEANLPRPFLRPADADLGKEVKEVTDEHTGKRLVEEELKRVRAALNSAASGVIITDKEGLIKCANPAFLRMFEYEFQSEVSGKYVAELLATQKGRRFLDIGVSINQKH
jgi:PAS domain-containing protein